MSIRERMEACPVFRELPDGFSFSGVKVRLAMPEERPLWDALMNEHPLFSRKTGAASGSATQHGGDLRRTWTPHRA